jgi:hypothetical protein
MGNAYKRIRASAALVALYAGWHLTGGLHGAVFRIHVPPPAAAVTTATAIASQCAALTASTASPSAAPPSPATAAPQLCVSVDAVQVTVARGKTATWTIQVSDQGAPAAAVTVTIAVSPAGRTPAFTGSCPSGGGTGTCTVGDLGTAVTPSSYQLQAQITVPGEMTAGTLSLTATADTSPPMTTAPVAGQAITVTGAVPAAKPSHTPSPAPTTHTSAKPPPQPAATPAAQRSPLPVIQFTPAPATGTLPTANAAATTVPPGSISTVLPQITPAIAAPVPAAVITSSPAANVVPIGGSPISTAIGGSPAPTAGSGSLSISIGMSAQTAQVLGYILLTLVITLIASKFVTSYFTRTRQPRQDPPKPTPSRHHMKLPRLALAALPHPHLPRLHLPHRPRSTRADRAAIRQQNWQHHLESQKNATAAATTPVPAPEASDQSG